MRKYVTVVSVILSAGLLLLGCASVTTQKDTTQKDTKSQLTLVTDDKRQLEAGFYPAPFEGVPAVILLPDSRCDYKAFGAIPSRLNQAGFAVLAMDFRYKDIISKTRTPTGSWNIQKAVDTIQKQDLNILVDQDLKAALDFMSKQKGVSANRICLIGTSLGSRIALIGGPKYKVHGLVLVSLSGEEALPGVKPIKSLLEDYGDCPVLFMTAEKDWGGNYKAAADNRQYFEWAYGPKELKVWPGGGHGIDLIESQAQLEFLTRWLRDKL